MIIMLSIFIAVEQNQPSTVKRIKLDDKSLDESIAEDLGIPLAEPFVLPESFITGTNVKGMTLLS